ncbi:MAG: DUF4112 domain-containing protein [Planctomycetota bacterium]
MTILEARNPARRTARLAALARLKRYATWLDASIGIPGTRWRIGPEAILGLIPGIGDSIGLILSLYPLVVARQHGVRWSTFLLMVRNILVDAAVGTVPIAGDAFDVWYQANLRNVALLEREWGEA